MLAAKGVARREARATIGKLRDKAVAPATLRRYIFACSLFLTYVGVWEGFLADDWERLDLQLGNFIEYLWSEGETRQRAADSLSGAQHFLQTRRHFPGAWRLLSTWQRMEMPDRAPPLPPLVLFALCGLAEAQGRSDFVAVLLLSFHCMLRSMEGVGATVGQIALQTDFTGVLALPWTKIGQQRGAQELVTIDDPKVGLRVGVAMSGRTPGETLLKCSANHFKNWFSSSLEFLGLGHFGFRLYSLRRGGATHDFRVHGSVSRTLLRGRWSGTSVARIYVTEGLALLTQMHFPNATVELLEYYVGKLR